MTLFHIKDYHNKIVMAFRTKNNLKIKDITKSSNCDVIDGDGADEEWLKLAYSSKDNIIEIKQSKKKE